MQIRLSGLLRKSRASWLFLAATATVTGAAAASLPNLFPFRDPSGVSQTYSSADSLDENGPFFQVLGTNGRTCATCHVPANGFGLSAERAESIFRSTNGRDPLFAPVDGAACPTATTAHPLNFDLLRHYGLFRIELPLAANPQFTITAVHDPYGCAVFTDPAAGVMRISVYRRPLPATNLGFLTDVQFDGRDTVAPLNDPHTYATNLVTDLLHQALNATMGHAQASVVPSQDQLIQIVAFEAALNSAQAIDSNAGALNSEGAFGGPRYLSTGLFFPGINDSTGANPTGAAFNSNAFTLYSQWATSDDSYRRSVSRGEEIFNARAMSNGSTCSSCHDTPNVGNRSAGYRHQPCNRV